METIYNEYAFIISPRSEGEYEGDELGAAFLKELRSGNMARPHRIRGSTWGEDDECGAFFFSVPNTLDDINVFYVGMGRAAEGWDGDIRESFSSVVHLPEEWREDLERALGTTERVIEEGKWRYRYD